MGFSIFQNWEFSIKSDDKKQEEAERGKGKEGDSKAISFSPTCSY